MRHLGPCGDGKCICHRYSLEFRLGCAGFPRDNDWRLNRRFGAYTWNGRQQEKSAPFALKTDPDVLQVGDKVSRGAGFRRPGKQVIVIKRSPKYIYLDDGSKHHVEARVPRDYEVWDDKRERVRAQAETAYEAERRFYILDMVVRPFLAEHRTSEERRYLTSADAVRDPSWLDRAEELLKRQAHEREELIDSVIAGRVAESTP